MGDGGVSAHESKELLALISRAREIAETVGPLRKGGGMNHANDNYPPVLTRSQAAAMCQLTPAGFDVWVRKRIVPAAIEGTRRWSRDAILRALSGADAIGVDAALSPFEQWEAENARTA